jgi:DNA mismatch endonuclease (patch repair protein)
MDGAPLRMLSLGGSIRVPYPEPMSADVTAVMKGNRATGTKPEELLRSALHRRGHRFRKNYPVATSKRRARPDIVFTRKRVAVFVDGCFWHVCPEHGRQPRSNSAYWDAKLSRNASRDRETDADLEAAGWTVVRVWEHERPEDAIRLVEAAVGRPGQPS